MNRLDRQVINQLLEDSIIRLKGVRITKEDYPEIYKKIIELTTSLRN